MAPLLISNHDRPSSSPQTRLGGGAFGRKCSALASVVLVLVVVLMLQFAAHSAAVLKGPSTACDFAYPGHLRQDAAAAAPPPGGDSGPGSATSAGAADRSGRHPELPCASTIDSLRSGTAGDPNGPRAYLRRTDTDPPFWVSLHNESIDAVRWPMMRYGVYYERDLTDALRESLSEHPGSLMLDVGGNIGWFSLVAASLGHDAAAFEPNPINLFRICQSLAMNGWADSGRVRIYPYGVGDVDGQRLRLHTMADGNPGASLFLESAATRISATRSRHNFFEVTTLDVMAEEKGWFHQNRTIAFLKVDVEGFEPHVFRGAKRLLRSGLVKNICFEFYPERFSGKKENERDMLAALLDAGYYLHKIGGWRGPSDTNVPASNNTLATALTRKCGAKGCNLWFKETQ